MPNTWSSRGFALVCLRRQFSEKSKQDVPTGCCIRMSFAPLPSNRGGGRLGASRCRDLRCDEDSAIKSISINQPHSTQNPKHLGPSSWWEAGTRTRKGATGRIRDLVRLFPGAHRSPRLNLILIVFGQRGTWVLVSGFVIPFVRRGAFTAGPEMDYGSGCGTRTACEGDRLEGLQASFRTRVDRLRQLGLSVAAFRVRAESHL